MVATTVTASVLAPRLMVKLPAIGQRSMLTASFRDGLEVILKSGYFLNRKLARRGQLWLVRDGFDKAISCAFCTSAFSSEVDTGSREESASEQELSQVLMQSGPNGL